MHKKIQKNNAIFNENDCTIHFHYTAYFSFYKLFSIKFDFFIQLFYSLNKKAINAQTIAFI
ncbi:hypothetical protein A7K69_11515 [Parageobacillus thermoglucosidasius]|uniref:Uncharacterized protein n=1 Tax=Parageobacillus thermoglucosidasius TaxID=1426 RepID=A0A1B7KPK4_PARTM|nr:hypothetical protein A7K69_11515 [Parageobacillus thermoglucosidasius]